AELAEHFSQSTEEADLEKAVRYGELAAQRAMQVFAYGEAVRHLEQALRAQEVLNPEDRAKRCEVTLGLADALGPAGNPAAALNRADEAFLLSEALGDDDGASRACRTAYYAL